MGTAAQLTNKLMKYNSLFLSLSFSLFHILFRMPCKYMPIYLTYAHKHMYVCMCVHISHHILVLHCVYIALMFFQWCMWVWVCVYVWRVYSLCIGKKSSSNVFILLFTNVFSLLLPLFLLSFLLLNVLFCTFLHKGMNEMLLYCQSK